MGVLIGENSFFPTWGRLRRPIMSSATTFTQRAFNVTWSDGFKTTEGNGFVMSEPTFPYLGGPFIALIAPNFTHLALLGVDSYIPLHEDDATELIGATVTSAGGSIVLTSDYATSTGQDISGTTYGDPATAIDNLTPF
jgi:hypothetical protein